MKSFYIKEISNVRQYFLINNFHGRFLRVILFERMPEVIKLSDGKYIGANYRMMKIMSEKMNFTPVLLNSSDRKKFGEYIDGKFTGGLGDIVYGKSDIAMNGYFIKDNSHHLYVYLVPINLDYVCIVVPKASPIPKYLIPLMCFPNNVWLAIIVTFLLIAIFRYIISYAICRFVKYDKYLVKNVLLTTLLASINLPLSISQYKFTSRKIVLIVYLMLMNIIVSSFQATLVTLLSVPKYYKDIDSLYEFKNSGMEILTSSSSIMKTLINDSTVNNVRKIASLNSSFISRNFNFGFFARFTYFKRKDFDTWEIRKNNYTYDVHTISECPLMYYTSFVVSAQFPYIQEFNAIITRILEAGFFLKWNNELLYMIGENDFKWMKRNKRYERVQNKTFSLQDLEIAFLILIIGHLLGIIVFIGEILSVKYY
ncbi:hypothetical protein PGB90_006649 [Kerria lacca]